MRGLSSGMIFRATSATALNTGRLHVLVRPSSCPFSNAAVRASRGSEACAAVGLRSSTEPWTFLDHGRFVTELPQEQVFTGFDGLEDLGLLLELDEENEGVEEDEEEESWGGLDSKASRDVRHACHSPVTPDQAPCPRLVVLSRGAAADSGMHIGEMCSDEFGNWVGQLGDGRVATLGEAMVPEGCSSTSRSAEKRGASSSGGSRGGVGGSSCGKWPGHLVEVQLKGIGKTPFSREGDGKAVLGACLREFLVSEALAGLGLPTTRAVSVCTTGQDTLVRDLSSMAAGATSAGSALDVFRREPGAVLCRTSPSFLRFGSLELPARRGELKVVRSLADFCLRHLLPLLDVCGHGHGSSTSTLGRTPSQRRQTDQSGASADAPDGGPAGGDSRPSCFDEEGLGRGEEDGAGDRQREPGILREQPEEQDCMTLLVGIITATARMVAGWQAFGFCHGVLNTDNMTLMGLALDFGPSSFMEGYDPAFCPNPGDSAKRYTFEAQPDIAAWNCERLADSMASLAGHNGVQEAARCYWPAYWRAYSSYMQDKLGLQGLDLTPRNTAGSPGWGEARDRGSEAAYSCTAGDAEFVGELHRLMARDGTDWTATWRALADVPGQGLETAPGGPAAEGRSDAEVLAPLRAVLTAAGVLPEKACSSRAKRWATWTREYMLRIHAQEQEATSVSLRRQGMLASNPAYTLRRTDIDEAVKAAEDGCLSKLVCLCDRLANPY